MLLRQRIPVADVGVVDAVQRHVHAANAQHGRVKIKAVKQLVVKMPAQRIILKKFWVLGAQILARHHQKAAGACRRVANDI